MSQVDFEGAKTMTDKPQGGRVAALSIRSNIVFSMLAQGYYAFTQFALIVVTARLGTPQDVGALALATAIVTPLFFLTSMGMRMVHPVDDLDRFSRSDYTALRFLGSLVSVAAAICIVILFYADSDGLVTASIVAFSLVKFASAQQSLNHAMFQRAERLDFVGLSILSRNTFGLLAFGLAFWATRSLPIALICEALAWASSYMMVDRRLLSRIGADVRLADVLRASPRNIGKLALWLLPVGWALMMNRGTLSIPPIVLEQKAGLAAVGVFAALAYAHTALTMLGNAITGASAARIRRYLREGRKRDFWTLAGKMMLFSTCVGISAIILAWLLGAQVLRLIFGPEYAQRDLFVIIMSASAVALVGQPLAAALTAVHAFYWRSVASTAAFLVGLVFCLLLIPSQGSLGAAWAMMLSQLVHFGMTVVALQVAFGRKSGAFEQ